MTTEQIYSFAPIILVMVFFYFFIIRPQNKQQKKIQSMRNNLKKGDKIVTIGGFHGKVLALKDNVLTIQLKPDNVKVQISKAAIAEVVDPVEDNSNEEDDRKDK